jgi:imidazoleglycerol-phosphate dehydratase
MTRAAAIHRKTSETDITVEVDLDGTGAYSIATGVGFLDHMLEQLSRHSLIDIRLSCNGDLHIDQHHTVEDCGIALGQAIHQALGDRRGIRRYGDALSPMDEALTRVALDISGRPHLSWAVAIPQPRLGAMDSELFAHWFHSFAGAVGMTLHVKQLAGENSHHIIESCFKGLARALREATEIDSRKAGSVPSTKGML